VECGKTLPLNATSSICTRCQRRMARRRDEYGDDWDYGMNG
jgi:hypothetical protein